MIRFVGKTRRGYAWATFTAFVMGAWLTGSGCAPQQSDVGRVGDRRSDRGDLSPAQVAQLLEPNVVGVAAIYDPFNPWIRSENKTAVRGAKIGALYLIGPEGKGIFGDGVIRPKLFLGKRGPLGKITWGDRPAKEWAFSVEQAIPFRSKRRNAFGWGYSLFLDWRDMDFAGKDIRIVISFERGDGAVVTSDSKDLRVPQKG